jgi:hypothetical protein
VGAGAGPGAGGGGGGGGGAGAGGGGGAGARGGGGRVLVYSVEEKMAAAREIRDHLLQLPATKYSSSSGGGGEGVRRPTPVVRCCGGSSNPHVWGNLTPSGTPSTNGNFARLLWEVRGEAAIGFEPGCVQKFPGCHSNLTEMLACVRCTAAAIHATPGHATHAPARATI